MDKKLYMVQIEDDPLALLSDKRQQYGEPTKDLSEEEMDSIIDAVEDILDEDILSGELGAGSNFHQQLKISSGSQIGTWSSNGMWGKYEELFGPLVNCIKKSI